MADGTQPESLTAETSGGRYEKWRDKLPIMVISVVFAITALAYSVRVPIYEAPDEPQHVQYVESLAFDGEFADPEITHQAQHPPLYYAIDALFVRALGLPPAADLPLNPAFFDLATNPNAPAYHHVDEDFPWRRDILTVQVMRALTVPFGMAVVVFTYLIALLLFPARRMLAIASAASAAAVPQFGFISGVVNNDVPAAAFAALAVYSGIRYLKFANRRWLAVSALAVGLAALTKSTAAISAVVPLIAVVSVEKDWRDRAASLLVLSAAPAILAGWYYVRSLILWGNLFARVNDIHHNPRGITDAVYRTDFVDTLVNSYWYVGGWMNVEFNSLVYQSLNIFPVLATAGILVAFRRPGLDRFQRTAMAVLAALPAIAVLIVLQYCLTQDYGPQGRYLLAAQPAVAILLAFGVSNVFARDADSDHAAMFALPGALVLLNLWILAVKIPDVYG
jgi:4-amino-4-deoxy-L-arabinose transferase-like glycosyltransferase